MTLEVVPLDHLPSTHIVHVALFRDVKNAPFLQQQLLARNAEFEYALIDASVVSSTSPPLLDCVPPEVSARDVV